MSLEYNWMSLEYNWMSLAANAPPSAVLVVWMLHSFLAIYKITPDNGLSLGSLHQFFLISQQSSKFSKLDLTSFSPLEVTTTLPLL